ncbi:MULTISPECIES: SH3 domain-containing protein [unclassified Tenacibaculum]|uniref:SH3 domain-containing protein n=1 Tax=unclassified Tenacibaculum TaxID=2635139 RepID=UPI001F2A3B84|nr:MULTISPECIES: SH3 domain-containing protein [unclassified Tenacibaculum]MCF2875192.1 SH3 domain-containing protein [Tenacibaculum sp. Cn5-1]MCF2935268.1 SH3 domain-containing protein [Tenacibaculum sp. Cn5-34]MCG7511290.1 SH3 domain-containing protein [Tenacibaculum sp. Cn5-46]
MKKSIILLITLFLTVLTYSQNKFVVTAENGLFLREKPNSKGKKIGKLYFGAEVGIIEKTNNSQTIIDNGQEIIGNWVKINFKNFPTFISNAKYGYVFDGYLKPKKESIGEIQNEINKYPEFDKLTLNTSITPFYLKGDFFGDKKNDLVILLKNSDGETKIGFINKGTKTKIYILGNENDPFNMTDYSWIGIFEKVKKGEVLWSNYEDDFVDFKDVPESKKVKLSYNSLYMHASESCGGGFVFWKNGKFNWLQQE